MQYNLVSVETGLSSGVVYDSNNRWMSGADPNYGAVEIRISGSSVQIHDGDSIQVTAGGETKYVFFPDVYTNETLWVSEDGSTYYDAQLCKLAKSSAGIKTPTPTPLPTSTPVVTDCLTLVSYPYTPEQTSLYALLNADWSATLDAVNEHCFRPPIGQPDIGSNAIGSPQLRDLAVKAEHVFGHTLTTEQLAGHTLTSFNINTTAGAFDYHDVFPGAYLIKIPEMTDWDTYQGGYHLENLPFWNGNAGGLRISWRTETDAYGGTVMYIDPENHWTSFGGGIPTATLDVNGSGRFQGPLTLDQGLVQQWKTIASGDQSPRVYGTRYVTANVATTYIYDFDDAQSGHEFVLWVADTNTRWQALTGNINFTSSWTTKTTPENVAFRFLRKGGKWYETGVYNYSTVATLPDPSTMYAFENFENGQAAGDGDWEGTWEGSSYVKISTDQAKTGSYSAYLGSSGSSYGNMYRGINTVAGNATITLWVYNHTASNPSTLTIQDGSVGSWNTLTSKVFLAESWTSWSIPWSTVGGVEHLKLSNNSTSASILYLDDITIQ